MGSPMAEVEVSGKGAPESAGAWSAMAPHTGVVNRMKQITARNTVVSVRSLKVVIARTPYAGPNRI
jgi:hypothetical protein